MATIEPGGAADVELQIDQVRRRDDAAATAVVRCVRGPVRLGARFRRIQGVEAPVDLELTRILVLGRPVDVLDSGRTALVTLQGTGTYRLRTGDPTLGWQIVQGGDPSS
ncbi:hypothetical protein [Actinoallomurus acaciae]|uniref:Uncharacterized protein n=1 Tax=Actinoallomurus acaciae TaxID=502577 RepID=A0ABV5Y8L1_9ACTN